MPGFVTAFDGSGPKIVFFSRGRGRGHAVVDIEVGTELCALRPDLQLLFVSYGTGARTFRERGIPLVDLGLPDANSIAATTVIAGRIVGGLRPDLVVAHEEFAALPAAKIFGFRTVMLTDFFGEPGKFSMESLWFADHILFLDRKGLFPEPPSVAGKVRYMGPRLRRFTYRRKDRERARRELGLPATGTVIAVFPGSWTEAMAPLVEPLLSALDPNMHLLWLAGRDAPMLRERLSQRAGVTILDHDWQIDRLMAASDLAITKTNRMTVRELASLGIRTLSLDYGLNAVDADSIQPLLANRTIAIADLTAATLQERLRTPEPVPLRSRSRSCASELSSLLA